MRIGIPKESLAGETRVACTPATVAQLLKLGFEVVVEHDAGAGASLNDAAYAAAGAAVADAAEVWASPLIYKVNAPDEAEIGRLSAGQTLVSFVWPAQNPELVQKLADKKVNVLAMDMVPRISRAQALDALSSMANISGYRAVIEAANAFGRFFTGQITAAGKVPPAQVLVIGAGVAGLAAIGTANFSRMWPAGTKNTSAARLVAKLTNLAEAEACRKSKAKKRMNRKIRKLPVPGPKKPS